MDDPDKPTNNPQNGTPPTGRLSRLLTGSPANVLREAIKEVPQLKYALGVLGIIAAISIALTFQRSLRVAVIGTLIMLVLMVAVVVFAALTKARGALRIAAVIMMFAFLVLIIATITLILTSVFFQWPLDLRLWVVDTTAEIKPTPTPTPTPTPLPNSASMRLREGRTLQSAIEDIAELDDFRAVIEKCSRSFMSSTIRGGLVRDETIEKLLEQLQFRIQKPRTRETYKVIKDERQKSYVIQCAPI
jgi:hypothetical protein